MNARLGRGLEFEDETDRKADKGSGHPTRSWGSGDLSRAGLEGVCNFGSGGLRARKGRPDFEAGEESMMYEGEEGKTSVFSHQISKKIMTCKAKLCYKIHGQIFLAMNWYWQLETRRAPRPSF